MKQHGVISSYEQYERLPDRVLDDCRMIMAAEADANPRDTTQPTQDLLALERDR